MIYLAITAVIAMALITAAALGYDLGHSAASKAIWRDLDNARNGDLQP